MRTRLLGEKMNEINLVRDAVEDFTNLLWYIEEDIEPEIEEKKKKWEKRLKHLTKTLNNTETKQ